MSATIRPWYWPSNGQPERTEPFTWIVEGVIAASWWPDPYVFKIYDKEKIKGVVNCCEFDNRQDVPPQFTYHHINVPDYGVPTDAQIERFIDLMDRHHAAGEPVVVHCVAGCGRTGQFIIAWCAKAGFIPAKTDPVDWIRARRKCCLETGAQINCAQKLTKKHRPS
ncbi:MAG: dual specificity protein phosphatase family protein [Verrucomicrobiales bacterium]|nr:dual specificity protein phosphatase family protein [Verrucomicrobiales bacterium]